MKLYLLKIPIPRLVFLYEVFLIQQFVKVTIFLPPARPTFLRAERAF